MTPFMSQLEPCSIHPRAMLSIHLRAKAKLSDAKQNSLPLSLSLSLPLGIVFANGTTQNAACVEPRARCRFWKIDHE